MAVLLVLVVALPCVVGALCLALGMKLVNWRPEWPAFSRGRREEVPIAPGVTCTVSLAAAASAKAAVSMEEGIPEGALKPSPDRTPFILAPPLDPSPPASPRAARQVPLSPVLRYKPAPEPGQQSCELTLEEDLPSFLSSPQQVRRRAARPPAIRWCCRWKGHPSRPPPCLRRWVPRCSVRQPARGGCSAPRRRRRWKLCCRRRSATAT